MAQKPSRGLIWRLPGTSDVALHKWCSFTRFDWSTFLSTPRMSSHKHGPESKRISPEKNASLNGRQSERPQFEWCCTLRFRVLSYGQIRLGRKQGYGAFGNDMMAMSLANSTSFLPNRPLSAFPPARCQSRGKNFGGYGNFQKPISFTIRAAKLPPGVEIPKVEPKLTAPNIGFTQTAEIWNARVCMIGLVGIFIAELIFHKGILQIIGIDVGKGLDLPL